MNDYRKTYKSKHLSDLTISIMKTLSKKSEGSSELNFLKHIWQQQVPEWAKHSIPYMIKNKTLFLKAPSSEAALLQYRETDFLNFISSALVSQSNIQKIKIIAY